MAEQFGASLRERRLAAGMSISELARRVHFSKGHLSKVENGRQPPAPDLARMCDSVLEAGGALVALTMRPAGSQRSEPAFDAPFLDAPSAGKPAFDSTAIDASPFGAPVFDTPAFSERGFNGAALDGSGLRDFTPRSAARKPQLPVDPDASVVPALRSAFHATRQLGMVTSPIVVLPSVIAQVQTLRLLAAGAGEPQRAELYVLASRIAEYAGWMYQETGDDPRALWWTDYATSLALAGNDRIMASYALFRHAEIALYQQDALGTIDLARQAQRDPLAGSRVLGLAARCEAQGHALAGDLASHERALDRAAQLLVDDASGVSGGPILGSSSVHDQIALASGWARYDLGRPGEAADILDRAVPLIPAAGRRARARYGARRVLAHAANDEIDHACDLLIAVLDDAAHVDSATIRLDLRQIARALSRRHSHQPVRRLFPSLTAALRAT